MCMFITFLIIALTEYLLKALEYFLLLCIAVIHLFTVRAFIAEILLLNPVCNKMLLLNILWENILDIYLRFAFIQSSLRLKMKEIPKYQLEIRKLKENCSDSQNREKKKFLFYALNSHKRYFQSSKNTFILLLYI